MVHARVGTPAARKPITAVKAATASRSNYHCRHVGLGLCRSHPLHQTLRVHTWRSFHIRHLVLPILTAAAYPSLISAPSFFHFPTSSSGTPTSTNPPGGTAAMFFYYLSSRRQPTSAPSCFSLYNHVRSSSATPTYASRRQPTLPPTSPTSAPSCFSLSNHVRHSHFWKFKNE